MGAVLDGRLVFVVGKMHRDGLRIGGFLEG